MVIYSKGLKPTEDQRKINYEIFMGNKLSLVSLEKKDTQFNFVLVRKDGELSQTLFETESPQIRTLAELVKGEGIVLEIHDSISSFETTGCLNGTIYSPVTAEQMRQFISWYSYLNR